MPSSDYANELPESGTHVSTSPWDTMSFAAVNQPLTESLNHTKGWWQNNELTSLLAEPASSSKQPAFAQKYGCHPFSRWNPQLGDGHGLLLGETRNSEELPVDLYLKGANPTSYSRSADGRAVFRFTMREYLGSKAPQNSQPVSLSCSN
ncbi:protein adenylyltransferase SelO family protein [Alteromonas sp. ASW11-130]|uniref:protein adenylyltransferase SelO family protein n=1 Tax=Alteromonas sp. ASW11-130 TaxID=3015775 RepID=UPI003FA44E1C